MDALPFCHLHLQVQKPRNRAYPKKIVTLGDAIRTRRLDLGLRQKDVAKIIGCDNLTITNWEKGHSTPDVPHTGKVVKFLGYNPLPPGSTLAEHLVNYRKAHGMTQKVFAGRLGIDPSTLASYEQGHQPAQKYRTLLEKALGDNQW